jgi:hypothetical protein
MHFNPDPRAMVALLATLLLASCAAVAPGPVKILPPIDLLQSCEADTSKPSTNGALAKQRDALIEALRGCNRDKERLREWAEVPQ